MAEKINITAIAEEIECELQDAERLVSMFVNSSAKILEELKIAVDSHDIEGIFKAAHSLKGSAGTLHLKELSAYALEVETAGRYHQPYDFEEAYQKLSQMISEIEITL